MWVSFPHPVRVRSTKPILEGMRLADFTNIDGEAFGRPTLKGFWRLEITALSTKMQEELALSAFVTAMSSGGAECIVPIMVQWKPNDGTGRMLGRDWLMAPDFTFDHIGFASEPFGGFTLHAAASRRDSYIDVTKPELSQLWPGHYLTLGDRLHQVVNVTPIDEREDRIRVSVMPNLRADYAAGEIVVVDQLRLRCRMETGEPIRHEAGRARTSRLVFIEAF